MDTDLRRPDKIHQYKPHHWVNIVTEDNSAEYMNIFGMLFSMLGIVLKYKSCAWVALICSAVGYSNTRVNDDVKQILSSFMLSLSAVVMSYMANPVPMSIFLNQDQLPPLSAT